MSEYISRNEAYQELREARCCDMTDKWGQGYNAGITEAMDIIDNIPVADVAPVVHGQWILSTDMTYMPQCSNCGRHPFKWYIPSIEEVKRVYKHCPVRGAKMDGEDKNNESI